MTTPQEERHAAIHEAGHAVAFVRLFALSDLGTVSIMSDGETLGRSQHEEVSGKDAAIHACAGYAALIVAGYPETDAAIGAGSDFDHVAELACLPLATSKQLAVELLSTQQNKVAVELLADVLLERGLVHPEEVEVLIDVADGRTTIADYKAWKRRLQSP